MHIYRNAIYFMGDKDAAYDTPTDGSFRIMFDDTNKRLSVSTYNYGLQSWESVHWNDVGGYFG